MYFKELKTLTNNDQNHKKIKFSSFIVAILLVFVVLIMGFNLASRFKNSAIFKNSIIVGRLLEEEKSIYVLDIVKKKNNRQTFFKFASAVADAYVSFEMIPYDESKTIKTVLGSLTDEIKIESFRYSGRDLIINGSADTSDDFYGFKSRLVDYKHFSGVDSRVENKNGGVIFMIICYN